MSLKVGYPELKDTILKKDSMSFTQCLVSKYCKVDPSKYKYKNAKIRDILSISCLEQKLTDN